MALRRSGVMAVRRYRARTATGRPCFVMRISSPCSTCESNAENSRFASRAVTVFMTGCDHCRASTTVGAAKLPRQEQVATWLAASRLSQDLIKAHSKNKRTRLRAPVSGIVQQLAVTTIGQVVSSGQSLMTIVPPDADLEIEAMILNKDVGFVRAGQPAVIKGEAFPVTRYGTIDGTVAKISPDAVDLRNAPNLSEASAAVRPQSGGSSSSGSGQGGRSSRFRQPLRPRGARSPSTGRT
jgi:HlyD family secretion protein